MKAIRIILASIRRADKQFSLFNKGDKIAVGVSGGKDSMTLLYALEKYRMFSKCDFEIVPVTLDLGFDGFDDTKIREFCNDLGLELHVDDSKFVYQVLKDKQGNDKHLPCSICSRMKKAAINKVAQDLGCNKVAFAHHGDDAIETLFLNEIFGSRIASFEPKMHLERTNIDFIRPLSLTREEDIIRCVKEENIPVMKKICPADEHTSREEIKNLLKSIYEKYPFAKENFLTMLTNYQQVVLWGEKTFFQIEGTDLSLKPVIDQKDTLMMVKIRELLFVEQEGYSFEEEFDGSDLDNTNLLIYLKAQPIGTIRFQSLRANEYKISRVAILPEFQKHGYATLAIKKIESMIAEKVNPIKFVINAQERYVSLYEKIGYTKKGNSFLDGKIAHFRMEKYIEK